MTKNELAARVPPSGRIGANAAWYRLAMITHNVLSAMKSLALPRLTDARPKRLRFSLFAIAGRLVSHAGHLLLRGGAEAAWMAEPDRRPAPPGLPCWAARLPRSAHSRSWSRSVVVAVVTTDGQRSCAAAAPRTIRAGQ